MFKVSPKGLGLPNGGPADPTVLSSEEMENSSVSLSSEILASNQADVVPEESATPKPLLGSGIPAYLSETPKLEEGTDERYSKDKCFSQAPRGWNTPKQCGTPWPGGHSGPREFTLLQSAGLALLGSA